MCTVRLQIFNCRWKRADLASGLMRFGVIDLGTNALRFHVYEESSRGPIRIHREKHILDLGGDVFSGSYLSQESFARTLDACKCVGQASFRLKVPRLVGAATSAVRDAANGRKFISLLTEQSGVPLSIISGEQEARFIGRAIAWARRDTSLPLASIDIGGGSTEISVVSLGQVTGAVSLPFGGARMAESLYDTANSPCTEALNRAACRLREELYPRLNARRIGHFPEVTGSSGTVRALLRFVQGSADGTASVSRAAIACAQRELTRLGRRKIQKRLAAGDCWRWSHLLGASLVLEEAMHALGASTIVPIKISLADGIAVDYLTRTRREAIGVAGLSSSERSSRSSDAAA